MCIHCVQRFKRLFYVVKKNWLVNVSNWEINKYYGSRPTQSDLIQSQQVSPRLFSPRRFSPGTTQSKMIQSRDSSVQDDSVLWQLSPRQFSPEWPDLSTFLANSVGLYTIQNYKDCKQYKIIKIVNNTKLYELFISPGNLQDGLHQVYE